LPPGDHAPDHPALHYDPGWRITPQAADPGRDGYTLRFAFYGTGLALRVQRGPYWAYYRITVDGLPANALPKDETGSAYLVLYDPLAAAQVVTVARGLPAGRHEARVEARGGWGQWALQGIVIYDQTAVALRGWAWVLLAVALLASAAWGVVAWPWLRTTANRLRDLLERAARLPEVGLWAGAIILALVFAFSRWLVVDMATLAGLGLLFMVRPGLALPLTAAAIPFWPAPKLFLGRTFSLYEVFIWVAVAAGIGYWVLGIGCGASRSSAKPPSGTLHAPRVGSLDWPVLALLASGLLSTIFAEHSDVAWREFRTVFLDGALFYWLITRFPLRRVETRSLGENRLFPWSLVNGLLLGMVAVSLLGLWQLVTGQGRVDVEGVWRVRGLYGSPNNLALVLDRIMPLTLALAAFGTSRLPSWGALARKPGERGAAGARLFYAIAALITATACLATFSKGALLLGLPAGISLVLFAGAWRARQRWPLWMLGGLAVVGILALAVLLRTSRFADLFNFQAGTSFFRLKLWQGAWQMGLDHPWLGVGPDNFLYAYRTRYVLPSVWQELNLSHPHNLLLDLWTRLGIAGLLAGGWAIV
jgi:O-antigen ligase